MANLRKPSKDKGIVGRFKLDGRCKKHPKHVQSPGVCSLCLKDKLAQLAASSASQKTTFATARDSSCSSSSSLSSYYSSSSASSCASPRHPLPFSTEGKTGSSVSIFLFAKHGGLVKSRSMAVVPRRRRRRDSESESGGGDGDGSKKSAKKNGFWFKLLHPKKSKRMGDKGDKLVRSSSARETVTVAS